MFILDASFCVHFGWKRFPVGAVNRSEALRVAVYATQQIVLHAVGYVGVARILVGSFLKVGVSKGCCRPPWGVFRLSGVLVQITDMLFEHQKLTPPPAQPTHQPLWDGLMDTKPPSSS